MATEKVTETKRRRPWGRVILTALLLLAAIVAFLFLRYVTGMLPGEQAAGRWAGDAGRFAQVTAFLPEHLGLNQETMDGIPRGIHDGIVEQGLDPNLPENTFAYAFASSAQPLQVSSYRRGPAEVFATGVGGNFFLFQPVNLISGSYLPADGVNQDMVLIDADLAWDLFSATDVAGKTVYISGIPYLISGVYRPFRDFASRASYSERPHLFFYYGALRAGPITMVQVVLPNPISGLGEELLQDAMESAVSEGDRASLVVVQNSGRYRIPALWGVIRSFGQRSMVQTGLLLPYWENAARMAEDFAALMIVLLFLLLLYPAFGALRLICRAWRRRKWRFFRSAWKKADDKREEKREARWRGQAAAREADIEVQYDLDEIIRSVRESEAYHETEM